MLKRWNFLKTGFYEGINIEYLHFFLEAPVWSGEITNMEPDKCDELKWFGIRDLPDNTIPYVRRAIENYCNGIWFGSIGW